MNNIVNNNQLASRIKEDRHKKLAAVMRNVYNKRSLGDTMRA
jgi:hypothetical protein